jgi:hypothetical protein
MTGALRTYLALALTLLLALTSQTMAVAQGAPHPVGQAVLCTGTGPVTVLVDAEGQPTGKVHICPDCALGVMDGVLPPQADVSATDHVITTKAPDFTIQNHPSAPSAFAARAPPGLV